jgi:hypothetical protein
MGFLRRVGCEPPAAHVAPDRELEVPVEQRLPNRPIHLSDNALVKIEIRRSVSIVGIRSRLFGVPSVGGRGHFFYRHAAPPNGCMAASSSFRSTRTNLLPLR